MKCLDRIALTEYVRGSLEPEILLDASEHICSCERCREALKSLQDYSVATAYVKDVVLGIMECPEYEELSAYVDGGLAAEKNYLMEAHLAQCGPCKTDVVAMRSFRARAELVPQITAKPTRFRRGFSLELFPMWQKAGFAAAVSAVVVGLIFFAKPPATQQLASNAPSVNSPVVRTQVKPIVKPNAHKPIDRIASVPVSIGRKAGSVLSVGAKPIWKVPVSKAADRVAAKPAQPKETIELASLGVDGALEARLERAVQQKLKNGSVDVDKPVRMALLVENTDLRSESDKSELAPVLMSPSSTVLRNSPKSLNWKPAESAVSYRVKVIDDSGQVMLHEAVEVNRLALSQPLERGKVYTWRVEANFGPGGSWISSKAARFTVISSEDYETVQRAEAKLAGRPEVLGAIYESFGLYGDAVKQFQKYAVSHPSALSQKMLNEARTKLTSSK